MTTLPTNRTLNNTPDEHLADHNELHSGHNLDEAHRAAAAPHSGHATTAALTAHIDDTVDAHDASAISFVPTGTIASTDVQAAIAEVASEGGGGSAYATVQDEGTAQTQRAILNFTGAGVTATDDAANGRTNVAITAGAAAFSGTRLYNSAAQSIISGVPTVLGFNSENYDTDTFHDTTTNNSRITIPTGKGGRYRISARASFATSTAGTRRYLRIRLNGVATYLDLDERPISSAAGNLVRLHVSTTYALAASDYVELVCFQDSGGALDIQAPADETWFAAEYLGA